MSKTTRVLFAVVACAFVVTQATAQDAAAPSVTVGGGLRAGASWGDGDDNYGLNNVRLYINGSVGPAAVEINTETSFGDLNTADETSVTILDAVAKLAISDSANVWVGRFLAPSDRANLSGPYYGNVGNDGPRASSFYYGGNQQAGRDDGLAVWGNIGGDMNLKYQVGIFDGADADDQMLAGRLVLNLWDDEDGYYNASTYYGEKQILAIGLSYQDGPGSGGGGNEDAVAIDVLVEKTIDMGTVTLDAAWYDNADEDLDPMSVFVGLLMNGETTVGPLTGKLRPYIRVVSDGNRGDEWAVGVQHVIDGHKASVSVEYGDVDDGDSTFGIGAQFQF